MAIYKIVVTGGPCAGKSTGMSRIETGLSTRGYKVFVIAETATEVITGGLKIVELGVLPFQRAILDLQLNKERIYLEAAKAIKDRDVVILIDRGIMDARAFMSKSEFDELISEFDLTITEIQDSYDGIFHLKTAADGAEMYYTLANNAARSETPEEARKVDKKIIAAWTGHPHLRVIDNSEDFDAKIDKLINEIYGLLGEPIPLEIERKYLIKMPDIKELKEKYSATRLKIIQTYLNSTDDCERRIRQRGSHGTYSYFYTEKRKITELQRVESEKKISKDEYLDYMMEADTSLRQIRKNRYCFVYQNNYIEMDVYPFWDNYAIVEVELTNENQEVTLPPEIEVIREVTEDSRFKNNSLAKLDTNFEEITQD